MFLAEGVKVIFRVALALLSIHQGQLLSESFEAILSTLKKAPGAVETEVLIETTLSIRIRNRTLRDLDEEYSFSRL